MQADRMMRRIKIRVSLGRIYLAIIGSNDEKMSGIIVIIYIGCEEGIWSSILCGIKDV